MTVQQQLESAWAHHQAGQLAEAEAVYRQILSQHPNQVEALNLLGTLAAQVGQSDAAMDLMRQAIRFKPDYAEAHYNLGIVLRNKGQLDEAIASYRQAIRLRPDFAVAHWRLAMALLLLGDFEEGWKEFEWRRRTPWWLESEQNSPQPQWIGQDARGKTILLSADGGFGDAMHYIRYAPLVAERGATVLLECKGELVPLLCRVRGISAVFARGERPAPFDWQTPLQSLPLVFGTTIKTIPADVPYLSAPPQLIEQWAKRLASDPSFKVGLVWAGSLRWDMRSCPLATFAPLAAIPGVTFYGLQKGPEANQPVPPGLRLIQLGDELADFADTAALVSNLDLVISVDTSVVHLAGGLARPVWTLIARYPGFQWLLDREDSPWYPTMRLFRQPRMGDWDSVIKQVADALSLQIRSRA